MRFAPSPFNLPDLFRPLSPATGGTISSGGSSHAESSWLLPRNYSFFRGWILTKDHPRFWECSFSGRRDESGRRYYSHLWERCVPRRIAHKSGGATLRPADHRAAGVSWRPSGRSVTGPVPVDLDGPRIEQ